MSQFHQSQHTSNIINNTSSSNLSQLNTSNHTAPIDYIPYDNDIHHIGSLQLDITNHNQLELDSIDIDQHSITDNQHSNSSSNINGNDITTQSAQTLFYVLYALLLHNYICITRLIHSCSNHNPQQHNYILLVDTVNHSVYNDRYTHNTTQMLAELKQLLSITDQQFDIIKQRVIQKHQAQSPTLSDTSSNLSSQSTRSSNYSTTNKQNILNAVHYSNHSSSHSSQVVPQVVPYIGSLNSRQPIHDSQLLHQSTNDLFDSNHTIHNNNNNTYRISNSTSQQWQPSHQRIVHTVNSNAVQHDAYRYHNQNHGMKNNATMIQNHSINRNFQYNANRNYVKQNNVVGKPKLPSYGMSYVYNVYVCIYNMLTRSYQAYNILCIAQKANGSTYMTESQFVNYFKHANSLVEAVKSIVRAHPTYREVSIYARARRMELRYDADGILTQGKYVNNTTKY